MIRKSSKIVAKNAKIVQNLDDIEVYFSYHAIKQRSVPTKKVNHAVYPIFYENAVVPGILKTVLIFIHQKIFS